MRIIDRYISREVFSHALIGLAIFTFVLFVPQLVRLMELIVRHSADAGTVLALVACLLPGVLTFTLPMAVLVGVMIGLGRMSADSETIALHAVGVGTRRLLVPIAALALLATLVTLGMTLWIGPAALGKFRELEQRLRATQASFEIQPRVFDERFPGFVLYVQDIAAAGTRWRGLLLAESGENGGRLTVAEEARVIADRDEGKLQIHLENGSTHEYSPEEPTRYSVSTFGHSDLPIRVEGLDAARASPPSKAEWSPGRLAAAAGDDRREARVELQRRLALPAACLVFALAGVPMGARPRRGGRAAGVVITGLLIVGYYLVFVTGAGMARRGVVSPFLGLWMANAAVAVVALAWLRRSDRWSVAGGRWSWKFKSERVKEFERRFRSSFHSLTFSLLDRRVQRLASYPSSTGNPPPITGRAFPLRIDIYLLSSFFGSLLVILVGFLLLFHSFTFFELLNDIARRNIPFIDVVDYFSFLTPYLVYNLLPLAVLVAVLVTLGVLAKHNEITAFKASGISMYRLSLPLLVAGLLLGAGMMVLDNSYLPYANQRQDALRNAFKGRPAQTFHQPRRQWIFGEQNRLYNYQLFDSDRRVFGGLNVFELDPVTFQLRRRIFARSAEWNAALGTWVLRDAWLREFAHASARAAENGGAVTRFVSLPEMTVPELAEPPAYFERRVRRSEQMNWRELAGYIAQLRQAGFDVSRLSVQWHRKFAFPLLTPVIVLLAIPFAFLGGTRGALGGVATALAIGFAYWAIAALFEGMGNVGQLPPMLAAWLPPGIFSFVGLYSYFKMPT
ncbi:MAG: LPS export ABC transporter permease LptF [Candidatus Acidiferrales bacterium]